MQRLILAFCIGSLLLSAGNAADGQDPESSQTVPAVNSPGAAKVRKFAFHYRFRVKGLHVTETGNAVGSEKDVVRVWLPCASNTQGQAVTRQEAVTPSKLIETRETRYGNPLIYFETPIPTSGEFTVDIPYEVTRREVLNTLPPAAFAKAVRP